MTNNANTTAPAINLEFRIRQSVGPIVQNYAADNGMMISEFCRLYDTVVAELAAYGESWTR